MSQPDFLPVPLNPRHDGWTPERQWAFVEALADTASVSQAAKIVGMSTRSAHKLRRHPLAAEFRAACDAALGQAWGRLEQVALERAINGEVETIERDGMVIATRRRPCSDRLLIHLLNNRERAKLREHTTRESTHARAVDAARTAASLAFAAAPHGRKPPPPEMPKLPTDAAVEQAAATAFHAHARAFVDWPALANEGLPHPGPEMRLAPASTRLPHTARTPRVRPPAQKSPKPELPIEECGSLRWQDYKDEPPAPRARPEVRIRVT